MKSGSKVHVTQIKSACGRSPNVWATLDALGLGKIGKKHTFTVNPAIAGMLRTVSYLLEIKETK